MFNNDIQKMIAGNPARGLFIIKTGIGLIYIITGTLKLLGGTPKLLFVGSQIALFGITAFPLFWGVCAMLSELLGGFSLVMGRYIKYVIPFTIFTMIVATIMHLSMGQDISAFGFPLSMLIVLVGIYCSE